MSGSISLDLLREWALLLNIVARAVAKGPVHIAGTADMDGVDPVEIDPGLTLGAVFGAYDPTLHFLGAYGVDTDANTAWAVINHNSSFIVVPEPSRALVAAFGLAAIALRRRRRS